MPLDHDLADFMRQAARGGPAVSSLEAWDEAVRRKYITRRGVLTDAGRAFLHGYNVGLGRSGG